MKQKLNQWTEEDEEDLKLETLLSKKGFKSKHVHDNENLIPLNIKGDNIEDIIPLASSTKKVEVVKQPEVVVFNDTSGRSTTKKSKQDWKQFMSSKVSDINGKKKVVQQKRTQEEIDQDKEDDMNDQELMNILEATKLVENYAAQELTGEDLRRYKKRKLVELGIKESKAPKMPFKQRLIVKQSQIAKNAKDLQNAKDNGLYDPSIKNKWKLDTKAPAKRDRGLNGHVGHFKNGVLTLNKSQISQINTLESSSKSFGRIASTDNSLRRARSSGKKKGKGKKRKHH
ncbi:hypothetical protein BCR32DRAFT_288942 [Anaeromyces robustus]|uniref:Uncharacterized protein n=1 Tax=Anaeromyces robustus TaxID=1754192 RepID=A0A1Y1XR89_9FUNG|nr:hypothetical protein BCR32DRAFT_288942 [Anaeromyces robustus]|eukprot:ORX88006.1 hypothetical protein BCR32DRAFT_288942 [Anaeromyces robustus]